MNWVLSVEWSPDGKHLMSSCKGGEICCWNPKKGEMVGHFCGSQMYRFDAVIHFTGLKAVGKSVEKPEACRDILTSAQSCRLLQNMLRSFYLFFRTRQIPMLVKVGL